MEHKNASFEVVREPYVRWMIRKDLGRVLEIAAASSDDPWKEEDFLRYLRKRNQIALICELGRDLAGYMLYSIYDQHCHIDALAVDPALRRRGVGGALLRRAVDKSARYNREFAGVFVRAAHLEVNQFVRSCGFRARGILRGSKDVSGDMLYFKTDTREKPESHKGINRPPSADTAG